MALKAIETRYNGYLFRSRLEARWAVFFDALDIKYEYEAEGFDLGGEWYLPDFWLPEQRYWLEVKPTLEDATSKKHDAFIERIKTGPSYFYVLVGTPVVPDLAPTSGPGYVTRTDDPPRVSRGFHKDQWGDHVYWVSCPGCYAYGLAEHGSASFMRCGCGYGRCRNPFHFADGDLLKAYEAARSARFERR